MQDRNVQVELEPMFVLTYYERQADVRERVFYDRLVERFNDRRVLAWRLLLTNREAALTEEQIAAHFASHRQLFQAHRTHARQRRSELRARPGLPARAGFHRGLARSRPHD